MRHMVSVKSCLICERIEQIKNNENKYFVKEMKFGYVVLGDYQFYKGYTLLLSKVHTNELHKLKRADRSQFLEDMAIVSEAVYRSFKPRKLNYELLGNTDSHLHWHIFPRYLNDPKPGYTTWVLPKKQRCSTKTVPSDEELVIMKTKLLNAIDELVKLKV